MLDRNRCPGCLSWETFTYSGGEFQGCNHCQTIAACNRRTTAQYDACYVASRYDRYPTNKTMSELRLSVVETVLYLFEGLPLGKRSVQTGRLLDVGYGNGEFIRTAWNRGWDAYGNDVNPTRYEGVRPARLPNEPSWPISYRVITFFDCLEHFEDLTHARWVSHATDWLFLSFPAVPTSFPFDTSWKHYRPGEHHLYFTPQSIETIMSHNGRMARIVYQGHPEDSIRKSEDGKPNIWTVALRCFNEKEN